MNYSESCDYLREYLELPVSTGFQELMCKAAFKVQELDLENKSLKENKKSQEEKKECQKKSQSVKKTNKKI